MASLFRRGANVLPSYETKFLANNKSCFKYLTAKKSSSVKITPSATNLSKVLSSLPSIHLSSTSKKTLDKLNFQLNRAETTLFGRQGLAFASSSRAFRRFSTASDSNSNSQGNNTSRTQFTATAAPSSIIVFLHNLLKIIIVVIGAIIVSHIIYYVLSWLGVAWGLFNYAIVGGAAFTIGMPIVLAYYGLYLVGLISYLPFWIDRKAYELSFDNSIVKSLNENPAAIAEFGSPISRTDAVGPHRETRRSDDRKSIIIHDRVPVQGPKGRGYVDCVAVAPRVKRANNAEWKVEEINFAAHQQRFKNGKRVESHEFNLNK